MKKIIGIIFLLALLSAYTVFAGEMYTWIDENGQTQITDHPPDRPGRVINRDKFKDMTAGERKDYDAEQKENQQQFEQKEQLRRQMNEVEAAANQAREQMLEHDKVIRKARLEKARRNIEDLEARKERYQYNENNAYGEPMRMYWRDEVRKINRAIMDNKEFLHKNQ